MNRVPWTNKLLLLVGFVLAHYTFYVIPNLHPFSTPRLLPLTAIDRMVPLIPASFVLYFSDYLLFTVVFFLINFRENWNRYARMAFGTVFLSGLVFVFFPTTYPRPEYPHSDVWLFSFLMNTVGVADTPHNCFPSLHVAMTSMVTWNLRHLPRPLFFFFIFWALAICVSTLTTKQHYFVDIVGGIMMAVFVVYLEGTVFRAGRFGIVKESMVRFYRE